MSVMTREEMISVAKEVNQDTLRDHLTGCRAEINGLHDRVRDLERELKKSQDDAALSKRLLAVAKKALSDERDQLDRYIVEVSPWSAPGPKFATLLMLYEFPERYCFERCGDLDHAGNQCMVLEQHEHERRLG